ncbi:MAG: YdbH domain-containing protein [Pseudomonadota bacterium]
MRLAVLKALLFLLAFLAALAIALFFVRTQVAELAIHQALKSEGITSARFTVTKVSTDEARIEDLELGQVGSIRAAAITVQLKGLEGWNPTTWAPDIGEVQVNGLRLTLDAGSPGGLLNDRELNLLLDDGGADESVGSAPAIPPLRFTDAEIRFRTAAGAQSEATLEGTIARPAGGALSGLFNYALTMPEGSAKGSLELNQPPDQPLVVDVTAAEAALDVPGTPFRQLTAGLTLTVAEDALPKLSGQVTFSDSEGLKDYIQQVTVALQADPTAATLALEAKAPDGSDVGQGKLEITRLDGAPRIRGSVTLQAAGASAQLGLTQAGGSLTVSSQMTGQLPPLVELASLSSAYDWFQALEMKASLDTRAKDLSLPGRALGLEADLRLLLGIEGGHLDLQVPRASSLSIAALDPGWELLDALPEDSRQVLWRGLTLTLGSEAPASATSEGPAAEDATARSLRLRLTPQAAGGMSLLLQGPAELTTVSGSRLAYSGRLATSLDEGWQPGVIDLNDLSIGVSALPVEGNRISNLSVTGDLQASLSGAEGDLEVLLSLEEASHEDLLLDRFSFSLPLTLSGQGGAWRFALSEPGRLDLIGASLAGERLLRAPAVLAVTKAEINRRSDGSWQQILTAESPRLRLAVPGGGQRPDLDQVVLTLAGSLTEAEGYQGDAQLSLGRAALPGAGLRLSGVTASLPLPPERLDQAPGRISVASARIDAEGTAVGGLSLTAELTRDGDSFRLQGRGRGPNGQGRLLLEVTHDLATESGRMTARLGPLTFTPDGLQPAAFVTQLEELEEVSGQAGVEAEGTWDARSSNISARLRITDLDATILPATITGLSTDLRLPSVDPPFTRRGQLLTIEKLDVGLPLETVVLSFQLQDQQGGPTLLAESLQADFAGGRLLASPFRLSAASQSLSSTLEIAHVKLDQLTKLLDLGDIQLEGRMIGQLPLTINLANEAVSLEKGWLQAVGEGVLRIPRAAERLGLQEQAEQQPDLFVALNALDDFRYSHLYATVSFNEAEELELALTLEGKNPAVREGYPVKFNINLSVNLSEVLAAFRLGREITPALFDGGWSLN